MAEKIGLSKRVGHIWRVPNSVISLDGRCCEIVLMPWMCFKKRYGERIVS